MIIHYVFRLNLSGFHYKNGVDTKVQHAKKHEKYRTDIEKNCHSYIENLRLNYLHTEITNYNTVCGTN